MNYCTCTNIVSLNSKRVYNTSSRPTLVQVGSYISWISADMDVRMGAVGITVPITTSPISTVSTYLRHICSLGSAGRAEESAFMGGAKNESEHSNSLLEEYENKMQAIEKEPSLVSGGSGASFNSYEYSNIDECRDSEPFNRNEKDW